MAVRGKPESIAASIALQTAKKQESDSGDQSPGSGSPSTSSNRQQQCQVKVLPLYSPEDSEWLSSPLCITRRQIQVFSATPADVKARSSVGGRQALIAVGRVGIRCIHCTHLPPKERAPGAVTYPKSIKNMHQAVRNFQRWHFMACGEIPTLAKEQFLKLPAKKAQSKKNSAEYWIRSCRMMGMVDADASDGNDGGIRFLEAKADKEEDDDGIKDDNDTNAKEANAANATEREGRGLVVEEHSVAAASSKTGTSCKENTERDQQTIKTGFFSSEDDTGFDLKTLGNEISPLDANASSNMGLASLDSDIIERLNFSQTSCDADGLQDSRPADGFCSELESWDVVPDDKAGKRKNDTSLETTSFGCSVKLRETEVPLIAPVENHVPAAFVGINMEDHPSSSSSVNIEGLRISAENDNDTAVSNVVKRLCCVAPMSPSPATSLNSAVIGTLPTAAALEIAAAVPALDRTAMQASWRDELLASVRNALELACTVCDESKHEAANGPSFLEGTAKLSVSDNLHALGRTLYQIFSGRAPSFEDCGGECTTTGEVDDIERSDKMRGQQHLATGSNSDAGTSNARPPLRDMGFPVSLSILVSCLLDATDAGAPDRYVSVADVTEDLSRMVRDPDRYLFDPPGSSGACQLLFPTDKLYGREKETEKLMEAFDRVISTGVEKRELVLVTGKSGMGKTALVDGIRSPLAGRRGMIVSCKFDLQGQEHAMSVIFRAFDEYCKTLLQSEGVILADVKWALSQTTLGSDGDLLKELIPHLEYITGGWDDATAPIEQVGSEAYNRIIFCLRTFVRAIAGPAHPVVVVFDDLQWADKACLDLINMLVTDTETQSLLFLCCFRDNEVGNRHPLLECLGEMATSEVPMSTIPLSNLDKDSVNELVSDTLHLSPRLTRPLSDSLRTKTGGAPLFVVELLKSLYDGRLLQYSASARRWEWKMDAIREEDISDNAVDLVLDRIKNYGPDVQWVLQVASCLGTRFDAAPMNILYSDGSGGGSSISPHLQTIVADGLITFVGSSCKFAHDQIWEAAYGLTPEANREEMHLLIGRQLLSRVPSDEIDGMLLTIVDQLNRGVNKIKDHTEKLRVAEYNLAAGEKMSSTYCFLQALVYLLQGCVLIEENDWKSNYDLSLRLFTACAEVQVACGNNDGAIISADPVLTHGRNLEDKLRAHRALVSAYFGKGKLSDGLTHGLAVLSQLGECFPAAINEEMASKELQKAIALVTSCSLDDMIKKDTLTDSKKVWAMRFLVSTTKLAYGVSNSAMIPFLVCRGVEISTHAGVSPESSVAFASLHLLLCNILGLHDLALFCSKISMVLLKKFDEKHKANVMVSLNSGILPYRQPMQACLDTIRRGYKHGMAVGDTEWASGMYSPQLMMLSIFAPERNKSLNDVLCEMMAIINETKAYKHYASVVNLMYYQAVFNLTCPSDGRDPTVLTGEAMDQEKTLAYFAEKNLRHCTRMVYGCRIWLAVLFRRDDVAAEIVELHQDLVRSVGLFPSPYVIYEHLYVGLAAVTMLRNQGDEGNSKWRDLAVDARDSLEKWNKEGCKWNFQQKLELLNAELAFADGDAEVAVLRYDNAIRAAGEHSFINEQALACERAGIFYLEQGNEAEARKYLEKAKDLYQTWGGTRKVEDIANMLDAV